MISLADVLARVNVLVSNVAAGESQSRLLQSAIRIQAARLGRPGNHISFRLPLLAYAAVRGDEKPALDLAAATILLYMGTDLLDDLADGDLAPDWAHENPAQLQLIAIGLFATLPQLFLNGMEAPPRVIVAMQRALLLASARMAHGQRSDIDSRNNPGAEVNLQAAWDCIEAKSGAAIGLLGELGALLADAPAKALHYSAFGKALGSAFCLMKDCRNLLDGPGSTDLANGTRTYPIVLHMSGLRGEEERRRFTQLLHEARSDPERRKEVLAEISAAGVFQIAGLVIDTARLQALKSLEQAEPLEPAGAELRDLCDFHKAAAS